MTLAEKNIRELTKIVFSEKYDYIDEPKKYRGKSGKVWTFDALVRNAESLYGTFIRDWKREISITQLRQLHKACLDVPEIDGGSEEVSLPTPFVLYVLVEI